MHECRYKDDLFQEYTGKDLHALWREYVAAGRRSRLPDGTSAGS